MHKSPFLTPGIQFKREAVEQRHLTGKDTEPTEVIYFKFYKSQIPVIEQAIETAALMLGTDKSRGYCLENDLRGFPGGSQPQTADNQTCFCPRWQGFSSS